MGASKKQVPAKRTTSAPSSGKKAASAKKGNSGGASEKAAPGKKASGHRPEKEETVNPGRSKTSGGKTEVPPADRLQSLRRALLKRREDIIREAKGEIAKYVSGEARQLVDTALDEGDWAQVDISEDINLMRLGAHRQTLLNIDESLRKIADGTYGICEECGEEISDRRLEVMPTATLCILCQERKEQFEAIEREGGE